MAINGGTLQSSGGNTFTNSSVTIGGDFTFAGTGNDIWNQPVSLGTSTRTITNNTTSGATRTFSGIISGGSGAGITFIGAGGSGGSIALNNANTYTGNTTISAGILALEASGSINNSPMIAIAAGATFDVSAISTYTLSSTTTLGACGTTSAATIKGGTTVSLGSQPITLTYDGSHPALSISQGALSLSGNAFTVNTNSEPALATGTYTIVQQASGSVSHSGSYSVSGTAIGAGKVGSISFSGGNVVLTIADHQPVASPVTYSRAKGAALKISITNLMAQFTSDPAADPLGLVAVAGGLLTNNMVIATTTNGSSVYYANPYAGSTYIIVSPTNDFNETFAYAVNDTSYPALTATNLITITVTNAVGQVTGSIATSGGGAVTTSWAGIPGSSYVVQRSPDLSTWTDLWTTNAPGAGVFSFTDPSPPQPTAYYRLRQN
jgi:autotransporter-associated beta strand protein